MRPIGVGGRGVFAATVFAFALLLVAGGSPATAANWLSPTDLSAPGADAANVDVAMDDVGNLVAVWQRSGSVSPVVQASVRPPGGNYSAPVDLSPQASAPRVAMTPSGEATVVFTRFSAGSTLIQARIRPPGGSFLPVVDIATLGSGFSVGPQVAVNAAGDAAVVWLGRQAEKRIVQVSTKPAGGDFSTPATLSNPAENAFEPQVAVSPDGEASVVWQSQDNVVQFSSGEGESFSSAVDISTADNAFQPQVAIDSGGEPTVIWTAIPEFESDPLPSVIEATTRSGGSFSPPDELSDPAQNAVEATLAINPSGVAVAAWLRSNGSHFLVQGATRPPGGPFSDPVNLSAVGADADRPRVAINSAGVATVAWQRGSPTLIQAVVGPAGGGFGAPLDVSDPGQGALLPQVAMDQAGDAVAVSLRPSGSDMIAQAAGYDANAPILRGVTIPAQGTVGVPVGFSAEPFDVWPIASTVFDFGDGSTQAGTAASHTYLAPGAYPVTVRSADEGGNAASANGTISIAPSYVFRIGKQKRNRKRGTVTLTIDLSGPGGVAVSGKTVKRRQRRRVSAGQVTIPVLAKGSALKRLNGKGKVKVRVTVSFTPDGGNGSASRSLLVTLIKKP